MNDVPLLDVRDLRVRHIERDRDLVRGVTFQVSAGETVALVGESGSGKSLTARSVLGLLPDGLQAEGSAVWEGRCDLLKNTKREMRRIRGSEMSLLLQDPFTSLNPLNTVGRQVAKSLVTTRRSEAGARAISGKTDEVVRRLREVGIDESATRRFPFELSGGMRQRVGMAAAIAKDPKMLIADEPTTALDATTQREVLRLLRTIQEERRMGLLLITHDLNVAFSMADRVIVMKDGEIIESAPATTLRQAPVSNYAKDLLGSALPLDRRVETLVRGPSEKPIATSISEERPAIRIAASHNRQPILDVSNLRKTYRRNGKAENEVLALKGVSLRLEPGESLGVVGESGSGKTTLARCILGLETPTDGTITAPDLNLSRYDSMKSDSLRAARRFVQCIFQDPYSTLNPTHSVGFTLREAIRHREGKCPTRAECATEIASLLADVGLPAAFADRLPSALSGGQRQRIAIARALALRPQLLICDEPVAALDLTVQAQVLDLLRTVQGRGVSMIFVTHDLAVARQMTDRIVVLKDGAIVEQGLTNDIIDNPQHAYTKQLLAAVPTGDASWLRTPAVVPA